MMGVPWFASTGSTLGLPVVPVVVDGGNLKHGRGTLVLVPPAPGPWKVLHLGPHCVSVFGDAPSSAYSFAVHYGLVM
jgi:hypothetical protein